MTALCAIRDCDRRPIARGLCHAHYQRINNGQSLAGPIRTKRHAHSLAERFEAKVDRSTTPDGCHLWTGGVGTHGYGHVWDGAQMVLAHRLAYELGSGAPVPEGLVVDHVAAAGCTSLLCVRYPEHLEAVTQGENLARGRGRNARLDRETPLVAGSPRRQRPG